MKKKTVNITFLKKQLYNNGGSVDLSPNVKARSNNETPDIKKNFEHENAYMLSAPVERIGKFVSRIEFYNIIKELPGEIVECGVFKGSSLSQFAKLRELFGHSSSKKIIAFDTFEKFPLDCDKKDKKYVNKFTKQAGYNSIDKDKLMRIFKSLGVDKNLELIKGNILDTIPNFIKSNEHLKISLLHIDVDTYEPTKLSLDLLYPYVVKGGIIILDDYGAFPGANRAIDEFFRDKPNLIKTLPYSNYISYVIK